MGQIIISNMWVCPCLSLPKPGTCLQLAGVGYIECQSLASKAYSRGLRGGINTRYSGILEIWIGSVDVIFGEDGGCWSGTYIRQLDWESLVKDNL